MFKDFSHSNSSKLLIWFISFSVAFLTKPYNCRLYSSVFLFSFFIEKSHFFETWFSCLHRFSIDIPNKLLWSHTFYCSLFPRLFIVFSVWENFASILVIQFFEIAPFFTPDEKYLHIQVYLCLLVKFSSLTDNLADSYR